MVCAQRLEKVRKRDYDEVKGGAQAMYLAESRAQAEQAFRRFRARWLREYGPMVRSLERDLPELLSFFAFPQHLWRKLRTPNVIERCFVEVRRRTRPMVCFVNDSGSAGNQCSHQAHQVTSSCLCKYGEGAGFPFQIKSLEDGVEDAVHTF